MSSLIAIVLLLVITLSGSFLKRNFLKLENLLPWLEQNHLLLAELKGPNESIVWIYSLVVEGLLLVLIIVVEKIRMGRKNGKSI